MDCYFINNLELPFNDRVRKGELYDRFIDEYFLPADNVCIAGGISEFGDVSASFLIRLAQKYRGVFFVYGGCDMKSDIPLDTKFENIKNKFRSLQKNKCIPTRLDGTSIISKTGLHLGGAMGFSTQEKISTWKWWTKNKKDIFTDERLRLEKVINSLPKVIISYYTPEDMDLFNTAELWHYGMGNSKNISEVDGHLYITNSCHADSGKFTKHDFLINL